MFGSPNQSLIFHNKLATIYFRVTLRRPRSFVPAITPLASALKKIVFYHSSQHEYFHEVIRIFTPKISNIQLSTFNLNFKKR
jgi:hypothetical protein